MQWLPLYCGLLRTSLQLLLRPLLWLLLRLSLWSLMQPSLRRSPSLQPILRLSISEKLVAP